MKSLLLLCLLALPALAQEPLAATNWQVVISGKFSLRVITDGKETRRIARPRVLTADNTEAEIRMSGLKLREDPEDKEKFDFALSVLPKVMGQRVRLKLKLVVEVPGRGALRQSCTVTATPGESVDFGLEMPDGREEFQVEVTPWVLGPKDSIKGWDAEGKPILLRSN